MHPSMGLVRHRGGYSVFVTPQRPVCARLCLLHPERKQELTKRARDADEAARARPQYVSAIDVLCGMRLLEPVHVEAWRKGRIDFLEGMIQGNLKKISFSMAQFREWAQEKGLKPSETVYVRRNRAGPVSLRFSKSGAPGIAKADR